jgi:NAD(P)-dependent dehydrogenase (short-subunit alcohol dehydrogenase family)
VERYGGVDVLVSNAGWEGPYKHINAHSVEDFDQVIAINVRGTWLSAKYAFPSWRSVGWEHHPHLFHRGGGRLPAHSAYTTSKHAVVAWRARWRMTVRPSTSA